MLRLRVEYFEGTPCVEITGVDPEVVIPWEESKKRKERGTGCQGTVRKGPRELLENMYLGEESWIKTP